MVIKNEPQAVGPDLWCERARESASVHVFMRAYMRAILCMRE